MNVVRSLANRLPVAAWLLAGIFLVMRPCFAQTAEAQHSLWLVVEEAGHTLTLLDAASMKRLHQVSAPVALTGVIETRADGRFAYGQTSDGRIVKYQLPELHVVAQTQARATGTFGLSADGRWLLVATSSPDELVLFDANLRRVRSYPVAKLDGSSTGRVGAILRNPSRNSFIITLSGIHELWEISWDPKAAPIFDGLVHDYRMGEGVASDGFLGVRRTPLEAEMPRATLSMDGISVVGITDASATGPARTDVINLNIRRRIATLAVAQTDTAVAVHRAGREYLAAMNPTGEIVIQDLRTGLVTRTVRLAAPVTALQATQSPPALWLVSGSPPEGPFDLSWIDLSKMETPRPVLNNIDGPVRVQAATSDGGLMLVSGKEPVELRYLSASSARPSAPMVVQGLRGLKNLGADTRPVSLPVR